MVSIGDKVTWIFQSKGSHKEKTGKVIDFIEIGEDGYKKLPAGVKHSQIMFQPKSEVGRRAIVEVPRSRKSVMMDYYAPYENLLKKVE
jgi:hypothetical protein